MPFSSYLALAGRFLLELANQAAVVYLDLDTTELAWREVILASPARLLGFCNAWEYIVDAGPTLTIHVAIAMRRMLLESEREKWSTGADYSLPIQEISVWRVSATSDEGGIVCGLEAERLSFFRHTHHSEGDGVPLVRTINLQGNKVILSRGDFCSVIKWAEADGLMGSVPGKVVQAAINCVWYACFSLSNLVSTANFSLVWSTRM